MHCLQEGKEILLDEVFHLNVVVVEPKGKRPEIFQRLQNAQRMRPWIKIGNRFQGEVAESGKAKVIEHGNVVN